MQLDKIREYAKLILIQGANIQPNQEVILTATTEIDYFCKILTVEAYRLGAKNVEVFYFDDAITKLRYQYGDIESFSDFEQMKYNRIMEFVKRGACYINLIASDPLVFMDVDGQRLKKGSEAKKQALREYLTSFMKGEFRSVFAAVPSIDWANAIMPNDKNPVNAMWEAIFTCCHIDENGAIDNWTEHGQTLIKRSNRLSELGIRTLHFTSKNGTDLRIDLCEDAIWGTAQFTDKMDIKYWCNLPTEEVGAVPHKFKVNGKVVATLPLFFNGMMIDQFEFEFKEGQVVHYQAVSGYETLKSIIETDDGAKRLGEVALVPFSSTVNQTGIIYKTTLFDENARCHLALGAGYPIGVGGEDRNTETLVEKGLNISSIHVDFMFGTADLKCTATTRDDVEILVMENGEIVI